MTGKGRKARRPWAMNNSFDGKLPPGWKARLFDAPTPFPTFIISDENGEVITHAQVDSVIPMEAHVRYCWDRLSHREIESIGG